MRYLKSSSHPRTVTLSKELCPSEWGFPWYLLSSVNAYLTWFHWKCFPESWRDFDRVFSIVKEYQTAEKFWMIFVHQLAGLNHGECMHESSRNFPSWESWEYGGEFSKFWTRNSFRNCHAVTKTVTSFVSKQKNWKIGSFWGLCYNLNCWNQFGKIEFWCLMRGTEKSLFIGNKLIFMVY